MVTVARAPPPAAGASDSDEAEFAWLPGAALRPFEAAQTAAPPASTRMARRLRMPRWPRVWRLLRLRWPPRPPPPHPPTASFCWTRATHPTRTAAGLPPQTARPPAAAGAVVGRRVAAAAPPARRRRRRAPWPPSWGGASRLRPTRTASLNTWCTGRVAPTPRTRGCRRARCRGRRAARCSRLRRAHGGALRT